MHRRLYIAPIFILASILTFFASENPTIVNQEIEVFNTQQSESKDISQQNSPFAIYLPKKKTAYYCNCCYNCEKYCPSDLYDTCYKKDEPCVDSCCVKVILGCMQLSCLLPWGAVCIINCISDKCCSSN